MDKLYSSKFSSQGGQGRNIPTGLSPAPRDSMQYSDYNSPGIESVDQNESGEDFSNNTALPVRQHHNKLEVLLFLSVLPEYKMKGHR